MDFPLFNTKELSDGNVYNINDPIERKKYFKAKLGTKIDEVKEYLDNNTFVGYMLAKKSAGKGTYAKLFEELVGSERIAHISVGDIVRDVYKAIADEKEKAALVDYLSTHYRGFISIDDALDAFINKSQAKLIPTEFILMLLKREIEKIGRKAIFIDGMPRSLDQISYSLFFRSLIDFRDDPDFFVLIDVPEAIIDERMKNRVICPLCKTSRNFTLLPTKFVSYDGNTAQFYLRCDNSACKGFQKERLVGKEGDEAGIESIRARLDSDGELLKMASTLSGVPLVKVRNAIPAEKAKDFVEDYEITPMYSYELDKNGSVKTIENPWVVKDAYGVDSYSLLAPAALLSLFSQVHETLLG